MDPTAGLGNELDPSSQPGSPDDNIGELRFAARPLRPAPRAVSDGSGTVSASVGDSGGTALDSLVPLIPSLAAGADGRKLRSNSPALAHGNFREADAIAHSLFSFSFSYNTTEIVSSRLSSLLKLLEKMYAPASGPNSAAPSASPSMVNLAVLQSQQSESAELIRQAKEGLREKNRINTYTDVIRRALNLSNPRTSPSSGSLVGNSGAQQLSGSQTLQRIAMPVITLRKASYSWIDSATRLLEAAQVREDSANANAELPPAIGTGGEKTSEIVQSSESTNESEMSSSTSTGLIPDGLDPDTLQLLEVLSTPYIDVSNRIEVPQQPQHKKPSLLRRASSFMSVPIFDKKRTDSETQMRSTCDPTPMFNIPAKQSARNAVFTTRVAEPYEILSLNDMACLMFGTSQTDARNRPITEYVDPLMRKELLRVASRDLNRDDRVIMSGEIFDIVKDNNVHSVASFWTERSSRVLVWVIEEINLHMDEFKILEDGSLCALNANVVPAVSYATLEALPINALEIPQHTLRYAPLVVQGKTCPCLVSRHPLETDTILRIRELRTAAAAIVMDSGLNIVAYNESALYYLLGIDEDRNLAGEPISVIIPEFEQHKNEIEKLFDAMWTPGIVVPEHMFRQVACGTAADYFSDHPSNGVKALTSSGAELYVDVQLRIIGASECVLWISFSRAPLDDQSSCVVPSQLELLSQQKRRHPTSSTVSSDSTPSTPASDRRGEVVPVLALTPSTGEEGRRSLDAAISEGTALSPSDSTTEVAGKKPALVPIVGARRRELTLNDFEILQTLGEGAYGRVVLAREKHQLDAPVIALKSIVKDRILVDTWTRDRRFGTVPNEIKIMSQLLLSPHPNIVQLIDFFEDEKYYHVEMARHGNPGMDLFDYIEEISDMPEGRSKSIFHEVASAVAHLHSMGIVHRDIKDENIVVDEHNVIKLIDFGSAAYVKQGPFDVFVGTVDYAAPEVLRGMPFEGPQQDVWALGILLYTILYKENPFSTVDAILDGSLHIPYDVSVESTGLIHLLLNPEFSARPSADQVLSHEWFQT